jgi:hypothetical protein
MEAEDYTSDEEESDNAPTEKDDNHPPSDHEEEPAVQVDSSTVEAEDEDSKMNFSGNKSVQISPEKSTVAPATTSPSTDEEDGKSKSSRSKESGKKDRRESSSVPVPSSSSRSLRNISLDSSVGDIDLLAPVDKSYLTARGDKSSLISDESFYKGSGRKGRESTDSSMKSSLKTPKSNYNDWNNDDDIAEEDAETLPSTIKKANDRRVSFNNSIVLSPEDSSMNDMSTVKEDYDSKNTSIDLSTPNASINKSQSSSLSPSKTYTRKSLDSIMADSTVDSVSKSSLPSTSSPVESPIKTPNRSKSTIDKSSVSSKRSGKSLSQADDEVEEAEQSQESLNVSKSNISLSKSVNSKSSRNASKLSTSETSVTSPSISDVSSFVNKSDSHITSTSSPNISKSVQLEEPSVASPQDTGSYDNIHADMAPDYDDHYDDELPELGNDDVTRDEQDDDKEDEEEETTGNSRRGSSSSSKSRKLSEKGKSSKSFLSDKSFMSTPGSVRSMAISTPGSHDFPRGRKIPDESFHLDDSSADGEDSDERETDKEEMDTSAFSRSNNNHKKKAKTNEKEVEPSEISTSFVDKSFLHTISPSNEKYAGKQILEETKKLKKDQKIKEKMKKQYHSSKTHKKNTLDTS